MFSIVNGNMLTDMTFPVDCGIIIVVGSIEVIVVVVVVAGGAVGGSVEGVGSPHVNSVKKIYLHS